MYCIPHLKKRYSLCVVSYQCEYSLKAALKQDFMLQGKKGIILLKLGEQSVPLGYLGYEMMSDSYQ